MFTPSQEDTHIYTIYIMDQIETKLVHLKFPISLEKELEELYPHSNNFTQIVIAALTDYIRRVNNEKNL